jgi:GNAT superfamily N-acetyltransferase
MEKHDRQHRAFVVRRMCPDDVQALETVFAGMSEQSRYQRFLVPTPQLRSSTRRALLDLSDRHVAFVAETADEHIPVGIARYIVTGADEVEIALSVVDAWHRRGVGRALLQRVVQAVAEAGMRHVVAPVASDNRAVIGLARGTAPDVHVGVCDRMTLVSFDVPAVPHAAA